jgi:hypothetical protein
MWSWLMSLSLSPSPCSITRRDQGGRGTGARADIPTTSGMSYVADAEVGVARRVVQRGPDRQGQGEDDLVQLEADLGAVHAGIGALIPSRLRSWCSTQQPRLCRRAGRWRARGCRRRRSTDPRYLGRSSGGLPPVRLRDAECGSLLDGAIVKIVAVPAQSRAVGNLIWVLSFDVRMPAPVVMFMHGSVTAIV